MIKITWIIVLLMGSLTLSACGNNRTSSSNLKWPESVKNPKAWVNCKTECGYQIENDIVKMSPEWWTSQSLREACDKCIVKNS